MSVRLASAEEVGARADEVWRVYDAVFGDVADEADWRTGTYERHAARDGYRLALAEHDDRLVGFAWGYTGHRGQYWSDLVLERLGDVAADWVGGHFEVVELAVLAEAQRAGLGGRLHDVLLDGLPHEWATLSTTADEHDPAVRLYRRRGWRRLGLLAEDVRVMGLRLR